MSKNVPKPLAEHRAKQYLKFLKKSEIEVQPSLPIFNADSNAQRILRIRIRRQKRKLISGERVKPKAKLTKQERKRLKKLRKEAHKQKQTSERDRLLKSRRHYLDASPSDLRAMPYGKFLESGYWWYVRMLVLKRDKYHCQRCNAGHHLQVHHLTYANHGEEHKFLNELLTLCDTCHKDAHGLSDHKPKSERYKSPAVNRIATMHATPNPATCKPSPINGTGSGVSQPALQAEYPYSNDPHRSPVASGMGRVIVEGGES